MPAKSSQTRPWIWSTSSTESVAGISPGRLTGNQAERADVECRNQLDGGTFKGGNGTRQFVESRDIPVSLPHCAMSSDIRAERCSMRVCEHSLSFDWSDPVGWRSGTIFQQVTPRSSEPRKSNTSARMLATSNSRDLARHLLHRFCVSIHRELVGKWRGMSADVVEVDAMPYGKDDLLALRLSRG